MYEKFQDRSRRVIELAQEEARMLNHNYIGTEHILLGLLHEGVGVAATTLKPFGVTLENTREVVVRIVGQGVQSPKGNLMRTPRCKHTLEASLLKAKESGSDWVWTEHILLALLDENEQATAIQVFKALVIKPEDVKQACSTIMPLRGDDIDSAARRAELEAEMRELDEKLLPAARRTLQQLEEQRVEIISELAHLPLKW